MDSQEIYNHIKNELAPQLTELQQAVLLHEVAIYREKIGHNLKTDVTEWIKAVCQKFELEVEAMAVKSRRLHLVRPRQIIIWGLLTGVVPNKLTLSAVGELFNRDHATALHSKKKVNDLLDADAELREIVMQLVNQFGWRCSYDPATRKFGMVHSVYVAKMAA